MSDFLPLDVVIDILTRLPVKTLIRCSCVCKSLYSLVTNPSFITKHLNANNNNNNNNLLLIRRCSSDRDEDEYDADAEEHYSVLRCENKILCDYAEFELPVYSFDNNYFRIVGSCNGVVCLSNDLVFYRNHIYLWNPSIQKTMALPRPRITFGKHGCHMHSIGFGFDSVTDDYKVVRIVYLLKVLDGYVTPPEVDIFSLSTGRWRNISHLGLKHLIRELAPQAFLNGAAHWLADNGSEKSHLIVSFHMGDEVFGEIKVPDGAVNTRWTLGDRVDKFQESLSLIHMEDTGDKFVCCIWVMKEYGMPESWTRLFNINLSGVLGKRVAGFTRNGQVLFGKKSGHLLVYDPEAKKVRHIHFRGSTDSWDMDSFYADVYTESVVLVTCKQSPDLLEETREEKQCGENSENIFDLAFLYTLQALEKKMKIGAKPNKKGKEEGWKIKLRKPFKVKNC
ncbi:F-box/kelch-repeat protein At3g06240-like [Cornus florida]|uniref:F-box/kelch-repeat protein At3g06240-like n=1 Tax=Cornus florida TaxID=4283 RepID=UPI0028A20616|nr:F-box/kelch-repeat protein At3g06240-like [Cornus florida]XP_059650937.1 F-box/kelch-repeat protein At3g06240-like [Cornus florida]